MNSQTQSGAGTDVADVQFTSLLFILLNLSFQPRASGDGGGKVTGKKRKLTPHPLLPQPMLKAAPVFLYQSEIV